MWLKQTFTEADKNGDGSLSISEVLQLLHKLNVNLPRQKVKQMFKVPKSHILCCQAEKVCNASHFGFSFDSAHFGSKHFESVHLLSNAQ